MPLYYFYAFTQRSVARDIMVVMFIRACILKTLLTQYLVQYLTHFHQSYNNDALWDGDERDMTWGQKVKGQGGIKYAENSTFWAC